MSAAEERLTQSPAEAKPAEQTGAVATAPASELPPVGEEIHLPGPSLLPLMTAIGLTLALIGVTLSVELTIVGCIITAVCVFRWVKSNNEEIDELPLDAHHE